MSKDIRSYFQLKKPQKQAVEEDEDVIPESPDVQIKNKKKESRKKKRVLSDDSDEEIFATKKKKPSPEFSKASQKNKNKAPEKPALKEVKVSSLFGSGPIKRTEPLVKKVKKNTETGIHSDEEFEKSLLEVDTLEDLNKNPVRESPSKQKDETKQKEVDVKNSKVNGDHKSSSKGKVSPSKSDVKLSTYEHSSNKDKKEKKNGMDSKKVEESSTAKLSTYEPSSNKVKEEKRNSLDSKKVEESSTAKLATYEPSSIKVKEDKRNGMDSKKVEESSTAKLSTYEPSSNKVKEEKRNSLDSKKVEESSTAKLATYEPSSIKVKEDKRNGMDSKKVEESSTTKLSTYEPSSNKVKEEKRNGLDNKKVDESSTPRHDKKRDFSEFVESNESASQDQDTDTPKFKKKKRNKSLNESVLTDEERHERKIHSAALYQKYLNRSGPKHLGAKTIPEGSPDCLANCAFLLTGVLDSFEREEIVDAIQKFGGSVKHTISKKVRYLLAGEDAGPAKMAKAQELGIRIIGEDDFLQMIIDNSNKTNNKAIKEEKSSNKYLNKSKEESKNRDKDKHRSHDKSKTEHRTHETSKTEHRSHEKSKSEHKHEKSKEHETKHSDSKHKSNHEVKSETKSHEKSKSEPNLKNHEISRSGSDVSAIHNQQKSKSASKVDEKNKINHDKIDIQNEDNLSTESSSTMKEAMNIAKPNSIMWVDKYKPQSVKQIIGQHGDNSCVKKLMNWLSKWYVNRKAKLPKPSPWAKNDDGGYFKAALLSGPPGVGKTTTVTLVCRELGFDAVEFNASDTRNKTLIKEQIGELLTTTSLAAYAKGSTGKQAVTKKHVLVMDEVDGMAGNEDRGGLQELIALIKAASVPIICMCNDRNSQKMRSLVNYCYDLRFNRPRVEQIKSAMMSICCKEGIKIPPEALTQLIIAANQDVRQTLNLLSMWAIDSSLTDNERLKKDANSGKKDIKLGPWDAVRKVFSAEEHKHMSINDKSDLFFYDYSLAPLFVQENYLNVMPHCPKHEILERISKAADSISIGDLVDARIRRNQAWNLLPMQAMYSSVMPGTVLSGHVAGQINFPGWLGKNSRAAKTQRLCQEIHAHTRLTTTGSKSSIFLDYCKHLRDAILNPLIKDKSDGVDKSLEVLESYHLLREDLDSLTELAQWPGQRDPMVLVDPKVKAAMTRAYNKKAVALPYAPGAVKKGRAKETEEDDEEAAEDDEEDSDPENDALIKKKKVDKPSTSKEKTSSIKPKAGSSKDKPSSSKDKPSSSKTKKK